MAYLKEQLSPEALLLFQLGVFFQKLCTQNSEVDLVALVPNEKLF